MAKSLGWFLENYPQIGAEILLEFCEWLEQIMCEVQLFATFYR